MTASAESEGSVLPEADPTPLVLVTVGSDHHPFDRLVHWVDAWLRHQRPGAVRCFVQFGTSAAPAVSDGKDFVEHDDLQRLMREATTIVTQGGPMSIVEARRAGKLPVVVPRDASLGEHVDNHQQAFARRLEAEGLIRAPQTQAEFAQLLDAALADPESMTTTVDRDALERVAVTSSRVARLADQLVAPRSAKRPRVLMIAGSGRSGSTLVERVLGDVSGVAALGETVHLWERGLRDDELCSCGQPFSGCAFWTEVGRAAFSGWDQLDPQEMVALRHAVVRTRRIPGMHSPVAGTDFRLRRDRMARLLGTLYRGVAEVSGGQLIVDSSKMPAYASLLRRAGVDLRLVYVVRDPRGVAYSWAKTVTRPEVTDGTSIMPQYGFVESSLWWATFDATYRLLARSGLPMFVLRYEDFVANPRDRVAETLEFAGLTNADVSLDHIQDNTVRLRDGHLVAGNPMRFRTGTLEVFGDQEWRTAMATRDQATVKALTWGLRRRYQYS